MTSPLSPEVVAQMVADLMHTDGPDGEMSMLYRGVIADAITTLAAENATLRAGKREAALQYLSDAGQAMDRIATLTEALEELRDLMCEGFEDENGNSGCGMCADECTGCIAHAAITTDKEPKT